MPVHQLQNCKWLQQKCRNDISAIQLFVIRSRPRPNNARNNWLSDDDDDDVDYGRQLPVLIRIAWWSYSISSNASTPWYNATACCQLPNNNSIATRAQEPANWQPPPPPIYWPIIGTFRPDFRPRGLCGPSVEERGGVVIGRLSPCRDSVTPHIRTAWSATIRLRRTT